MYVLFIDGCDMVYSNELVDCFNALIKYKAKFNFTHFEIINDSNGLVVMSGK